MALLQPRLNLKVSQKQVLTPGLVQMVSLLALNKQELKEMIDAELLENPLLEDMEETVPLVEDVRTPEEVAPAAAEKTEERDPFDEIDFGSYFQDYLDPGYRTPQSTEINEKPSFENFLSKPTTLTDHLMWQLGSLHLTGGVREAAELIIGNLDEDGYLTASDEELLAVLAQQRPRSVASGSTHRSDFEQQRTCSIHSFAGSDQRVERLERVQSNGEDLAAIETAAIPNLKSTDTRNQRNILRR